MRPFQFNLFGLFCLAISCVGVVFVGDLAAAEFEPYEARVTAPRALILSGPGEKFYPTGTLLPGDTLEVYREKAGGWLGVRPPKGSFSLVSEKELTSRKGDLAEIREDDVSSRIGSQLSDQHNAIQVRLKRGEVVEILGQQSVNGNIWYKIAPPAGEFRWIHAASVERLGPISEFSSSQTEDAERVVPTSATSESDASASSSNPTSASTPPPAKDETWRASSTPSGTTTPAAEVTPPPLAPLTISSSAADTAPESAPTPPPAAASAGAAAAPTAPVGFDLPRQLTDIEVRLSRMASSPPQLWNTEQLQRDTEQLLGQAKTPAERDAIKVTMGKIDQFTALARRYQQVPANGVAAGQVITPIAGAGGVGSGDPRTTVLGDPRIMGAGDPRIAVAAGGVPFGDGRYDAVGVLRPVVSKRPGAPQFALVDERGQVVTFVSPTPDVNLQPYVGRRVGIAGNRGFIPEFNRAHVTAGRVTPLVR